MKKKNLICNFTLPRVSKEVPIAGEVVLTLRAHFCRKIEIDIDTFKTTLNHKMNKNNQLK